jgi:hypothetical protein
MKIKIRQHDASMPQEDGWSQTDDWLGELRDDNEAKPPGDGHAGPDGTSDPWPEILAQADAQAQAPREATVMPAAAMTTRLETGPEPLASAPSPAPAQLPTSPAPAQLPTSPAPAQLPTSPAPAQLPTSPAPAQLPTAMPRNHPRPLEIAQCSMCGIALPLGLLVPDGGQACADVRWYCKDAMSCTERWTTARPPGRAVMPADRGNALAGAGEAVPDRASA